MPEWMLHGIKNGVLSVFKTVDTGLKWLRITYLQPIDFIAAHRLRESAGTILQVIDFIAAQLRRSAAARTPHTPYAGRNAPRAGARAFAPLGKGITTTLNWRSDYG